MDENSRLVNVKGAASPRAGNRHWTGAIALLLWLVAGAVAFLPFALNTSPWNAVTLNVPGDQGNWWHLLVGAPFFLAFPMIWLRLRALSSPKAPTKAGSQILWACIGLSALSTVLVETPFLLHLAGTSAWQRLVVLALGFGILIASATGLLLCRRYILPTRATLIGLNTAYLANLALCLVVYSEASGTFWSRSGWFVSAFLAWPIAFEIGWLFFLTFKSPVRKLSPGLS